MKCSKQLCKCIVFLLLVAMVLPMSTPVCAYAAEPKIYLAYQNTENGVAVVKLSSEKRKAYDASQLFLMEGDKVDLCFINATFWKNPVWSSSDKSVVTVDKNGIITAVSCGVAKVTLTYSKKLTNKKVSASAMVYVGEDNWGFTLYTDGKANAGYCALTYGEYVEPSIRGLGGKADSWAYHVEWISSNPSIAEVSEGKVYARGYGKATVSALITNKISGVVLKKDLEVEVSFSDEQLQDRMDELVERLLRANKAATGNPNLKQVSFTTTGLPIVQDMGYESQCTNILAQTWFKNEFGDNVYGNVDVDNFPKHLPEIGSNDSRGGYSCFGFACFAQWYLYKNCNADRVVAEKVAEGNYNKASLTKILKPGDIIRINITKDGESYYHSMIFHSFTENGILVLDSNLWKNNTVFIEEVRYDRKGWESNEVFIYRVSEVMHAENSTMDIGNGIVLTEGTRYSFRNASSGWYMNVRHAGKSNGTHINLWPLDMSEPNTQCYTFEFMSLLEKTLRISPICAPNMYFDVRRGGQTLGATQKICIWAEDWDPTKELVIEMLEDGTCYLTFKSNRDYCIGAASATAAQTKQTQLVVCKKTGAPEQRWILCDENGTPIKQ